MTLRITELVEQAAEARHKQEVGQVQIDAMHLQDALRSRENEEMQRTRGSPVKLNMRFKDNSKVPVPPLKRIRG